VSHAWRTPGRYPLTLVADDGWNLNNSRQQKVLDLHVNRAPRPMAGPDRLVCAGEAVRFDGSASLDWDGELTSWRWDFADGATADGPEATHAFTAPGTYDVTLAVTDDAGASCSTVTDTAKIMVNAPPVAVADGVRQGHVGGAYDQLLFDASGSSDADGQALSYVWDLGDGTTRPGERVLHAFTAPGDYTVRLAVSDGTGLACGATIDQFTVEVRERGQLQAQAR
jgi:chitodextrinase